MTRSIDQKNKIKPKGFQDHLTGKEGQIVLAAFHCFVEKGIAGASTHAIAAKAGLNQGIIHYYFRSKDALLRRMPELFFQNAIGNIEAVVNSNLSPREKLESFLDLGHSFIVPRKEEWIVFNAFWAHAMSVRGEMYALIQKESRRFQTLLTKILREGERSGDLIPGNAKHLAVLLIGAIQGLACQYVMDPQQFDPRGPINFLKKIFRNGGFDIHRTRQ